LYKYKLPNKLTSYHRSSLVSGELVRRTHRVHSENSSSEIVCIILCVAAEITSQETANTTTSLLHWLEQLRQLREQL